ncbi:MAG: hypothetical protein PHI97_06270 [Desulfobulbus sp.]|nr:hypothetical protein [Desulfobulbus sp.]
MFLIKLSVAMAMVIGITWIAERVSSRFAGVLLGFPLGAGVSLFFIGLEQGTGFAAQSSLWTMQGLIPTLVWCLSYQLFSLKLQHLPPRAAVILSLLFSLCCSLPTALLLMQFGPQTVAIRLLLTLGGLLFFALIFRRANPQPCMITPLPFSWPLLVGRALLTGLIILAITGSAAHVGSRWSGVFSAFPATILPVVLILHNHYGPQILCSLLRELPMGMLTIVVFSLAIAWSYPILGLGMGTLCSYAIAGAYLLIYELWVRKKLQRQLDNLSKMAS